VESVFHRLDDRDHEGAGARASAYTLGAVALLEIGLGAVLNGGYVPSPEGSAIARETEGWRALLSDAHYWGSAWLIVHSLLHLLFLTATGRYRNVSRSAWLGAVGIFGLAFLAQVTGNLLPFERHDVQTAVIEGAIAGRVPAVGDVASGVVLQGEQFDEKTLEAWHSAHVWLAVPFLGAALLCVFGWRSKLRRGGWPRWAWLGAVAAVGLLAALVGGPTGAPATKEDYGLFDARPSWYTWPMHGALNGFEALAHGFGWIGSALLPGFLGMALVLAPWIGKRWDAWARALVLVPLALFGILALTHGGAPAPMWGAQEVPDLASDEGREPDVEVDRDLAEKGFELAEQMCSPCHGKNLKGTADGPDISETHRRQTDADWYVRFLKDPASVKPATTMPSFAHLSDEQLRQIAEWLRMKK
jgi:mono/diheme cytochrome c family protein